MLILNFWDSGDTVDSGEIDYHGKSGDSGETF